MKVKTFESQTQILENLLNEARAEADSLRKRLKRYEKIILSTRLIMGHEMKKPTTAISGYLDLICEDLEKNDELAALVYTQKAMDECRLLNGLNLFFLQLLKLDADEEYLGRSTINVKAVIAEIVGHFPARHEARHRVKVNVSDNAGYVDFNQDAFKLVMLNLIENALVYSQKKSTVWVEAEISEEKRGTQEGHLLKIRVRDNGVGIPKEYLKKIFSPFIRLRKDIAEGSGLGLTLVRSLVELNGGEVYIKSVRNEGTTVHLAIPALDGRKKGQQIPL